MEDLKSINEELRKKVIKDALEIQCLKEQIADYEDRMAEYEERIEDILIEHSEVMEAYFDLREEYRELKDNYDRMGKYCNKLLQILKYDKWKAKK